MKLTFLAILANWWLSSQLLVPYHQQGRLLTFSWVILCFLGEGWASPRLPVTSLFCGGASWLSILCGLSITPMEKDIIEHHLFTLNLWVIFVMFSVWTQAKWSQRFYVNWSKFYLEISWWRGCSFYEVVVSHLEQSRTRSVLNVSLWQTLFEFSAFPLSPTHTHM